MVPHFHSYYYGIVMGQRPGPPSLQGGRVSSSHGRAMMAMTMRHGMMVESSDISSDGAEEAVQVRHGSPQSCYGSPL